MTYVATSEAGPRPEAVVVLLDDGTRISNYRYSRVTEYWCRTLVMRGKDHP